MRYGIFADIHANLEALNAVTLAYKKESIDKYLNVGDIVGYAVNANECTQQVSALVMANVAGNHDLASLGSSSINGFNPYAKIALYWTRENLDKKSRVFLGAARLIFQNVDLTLVHGTLDHPENFNYLTDRYISGSTFKFLKTKVCFIGHTHIPAIFIKDKDGHISYRGDNFIKIEEDKSYIINVGSVGQPRDGNPQATYCVYDNAKNQIQIKRVSYDITTTQKKIVRAGLPIWLATRLASGR